MVTAVVEESTGKDEHHVDCTVALCFQHAASAVVAEKTVESVSVVPREKFDFEADG